MEWLTDPQIWAALLTLTALEIVLGVDNLVFIAILAGRLPEASQDRARKIGLALALLTRLALLASLSWLAGLTDPLFSLFGRTISWRDLVLIAGGLFLLYKGAREISHWLDHDEDSVRRPAKATSFLSVVLQIAVLDIVFSLDSVITAIGMANQLWVMMTAVVLAVILMLLASNPLATFIERYPRVKMLALCFLLLVGGALVADGFGLHLPKGYIYTAIAFSAGVELLNHFAQRRQPAEASRDGRLRS